MKITVCDINPAVLAPWPGLWARMPAPGAAVHVCEGSILDLACDAVVSPANSFGFMDGGVDYAYSKHFGWHVQERVQERIARMMFAELLVGDALVVATDNERIPSLIAAPTMRVPKRIADPADIMLAVRAAVSLAKQAGFQHIAFPGMGTGCGEVAPDIAARATLAGITAALSPAPAPRTWQEAQIRHFALEGWMSR